MFLRITCQRKNIFRLKNTIFMKWLILRKYPTDKFILSATNHCWQIKWNFSIVCKSRTIKYFRNHDAWRSSAELFNQMHKFFRFPNDLKMIFKRKCKLLKETYWGTAKRKESIDPRWKTFLWELNRTQISVVSFVPDKVNSTWNSYFDRLGWFQKFYSGIRFRFPSYASKYK